MIRPDPSQGQRMLDSEPQLPPWRGPGQCQTKASRARHLNSEALTPLPLQTAK